MPQFSTLEQKLKSYTPNGECWEYNGCTNNYGYCLIMVDKRLQYAHRLAWEFYNKQKIPDGMTVDHICFNRKCINPSHLRIAKRADNIARHNKQLKAVCEKHGCKRKIVWHWSSKRKKMVRRSICSKCAAEYAVAYKKRIRMGGRNG